MRIMALGSDIVECVRIREMIERHGELFLRRVYTERELSHCQAARNSTERFAELWAAKEATLKCLGARSTPRTDIEVRLDQAGPPKLLLHAAARARADELGAGELLLTLAHCRNYATATAIAVG
jgi:holo-[acyl-carrier protein] synthase